MPSSRHENVRHATLLFRAEGVGPWQNNGAGERDEKMSKEDEGAFEEQLRHWVDSYERIFGSAPDNVMLSDDEQIPSDEMRRYIANYKKWFEEEPSVEEMKLKLAKLKKIKNGWRLNTECLDKIIAYIESRLS